MNKWVSKVAKMVGTAAAFVGLSVACQSGYEYDCNVSLAQKGWNQDSLAVFRADIPDSTKGYDIWLMLRNENNYPYSNLWLFVEAVAPNGDMVRDTVECTLANPDGSWVGGGWGSLYSARYAYRLNTRFARSGKYSFRISHGMRDEDIRGINSIGLRIVETQQDNN